MGRVVLESLVNPVCIVFIFLFVASAWYGTRWARAFLVFSIILLLVTSTGWVPKALTGYLEGSYSVVEAPSPAVKYVVVLSGGQSDRIDLPSNMQLYASSQQRLLEGIRLIKALPNSILILSGGAAFTEPKSESANLQTVAQWAGVPVGRIMTEERSKNTAEQAKYLVQYVQNNPFYLVTSAIHMPRSMEAMKAVGLHPIAAPTDFTTFWNDERWTKTVVPNPYNLVYFSIAEHEILGRWYYAWFLTTKSPVTT
jgi:uncharacterized SAM-binding protein YcdF (DUF218 family)